ncbi:MAG: ketopantoate reductase family protein [Lachnospiraceae bacterium]|nr:ketopantoate reductase family protein [Lachnospiraceae bacterium]
MLKVAVVGIGGVGGYLAGMLGGADVELTLVARGERKKSIEENGLVLHSENNGERVVKPACVTEAAGLEKQDIIFLCVKTYSIDEVCDEIRHAVTDDTIVVLVMNGVDTADRVAKTLGVGKVIGSVIYIVTFANADYSITQQGKFATVKFGVKDKALDADARKVKSLLKEAGVDHVYAPDIEAEIWKKYMLNCAYNVATASYDNTIGQLRDDKKKAAEYEALVWEAYNVATAKGVKLREEDAKETIRKFYEDYADELTSSLQRDLNAGRQSEYEIFADYLVKAAAEVGVSVPVTEKMAEGIRRRIT